MSDRPAKDDTTPIIAHARTAMFASLIVSAVIIVAALFSQDGRVQRALNELDILIELRKGLNERLAGSTDIGMFDLGSASAVDWNRFTYYTASFALPKEPKIRSLLFLPQQATSIECTIIVDHHQKAGSRDGLPMFSGEFSLDDNGMLSLRDFSRWTGTRRYIKHTFGESVAGSETLWDFLLSFDEYAKTKSIDISTSKLVISSDTGLLWQPIVLTNLSIEKLPPPEDPRDIRSTHFLHLSDLDADEIEFLKINPDQQVENEKKRSNCCSLYRKTIRYHW